MVILFDLDGTLIDSTEAILESFHNSFDVFNTPHPKDEEIQALIGHPLDVMYKELGVQEDLVWDYVQTYKEYYRVISTQKTQLLPNAKEAVLEASRFATLGIVTTKTGRYSKILMEHFGLMDKFEVLIGREDVTHPKPDPEPINKALERLNAPKKEVWMVGDTFMDLESANRAGVHGVGVLSGYGSKEELQNYTDVIFSDSLEAVLYLKRGK
jgi:phosphoglycolate phosphatase